MQQLTGRVRRCIEDYRMIEAGDAIAVGVSGGKDSLVLLHALANLRRYYPKPFTLQAITVSMGFEGMDFSPVEELCRKLEIPYIIKQTQLAQLIFQERKEKNPCSLCSQMRRGALNDAVKELGCTKLALGHHFDDAVETFVMSLVYEGRIACFEPVTFMTRSEVTQIRPMLYVGEGGVRKAAETLQLPVVKNPCPMDGASRREEVKQLVKTLSEQYPDLKTKIFGAMQRLPLNNWEPAPYQRHTSSRENKQQSN